MSLQRCVTFAAVCHLSSWFTLAKFPIHWTTTWTTKLKYQPEELNNFVVYRGTTVGGFSTS